MNACSFVQKAWNFCHTLRDDGVDFGDHLEQLTYPQNQSAAERKNRFRAAFSGQMVPQDPNDEPACVLLERICAERSERDAIKKPRGRKAKVPA